MFAIRRRFRAMQTRLNSPLTFLSPRRLPPEAEDRLGALPDILLRLIHDRDERRRVGCRLLYRRGDDQTSMRIDTDLGVVTLLKSAAPVLHDPALRVREVLLIFRLRRPASLHGPTRLRDAGPAARSLFFKP